MAKRKRRIGRPPGDPAKRTLRASFAVPREDLAALSKAATKRKVSISSIVTALIKTWLAENEA